MLPTPEEIREKVRERIDEQNRRRAEGIEERHAQDREQEAQHIERRIPEPSAQARNFIRTLDRTAATVDARLRGEEPPSKDGEAQIQINGERFAFKRPSVTPQFDTSV